MKKIIAIILACVTMFACTMPVFAYDTFEDKDKVIGITFDNPFGSPVQVYFGYNKYFDEPEDFIPRFEINDFSDEDFLFWLQDEIEDTYMLMAHMLQRMIYGSTTLVDEETGVSVTFDNVRFGGKTKDISLEVEELTYDEYFYFGDAVPIFTVSTANEPVNGKNFLTAYAVKLVDADGNLAEAVPGLEAHQMYWAFPLPEEHPIDFYNVCYWFPDKGGSHSGEFDYNLPTNNTVSYMLYEFNR